MTKTKTKTTLTLTAMLLLLITLHAAPAGAFFKAKAETQTKGKGGEQIMNAGVAITCKGVSAVGAIKAPQLESSQVTVHPEYGKEAEGKCEIPGIGTAVVTTTGCNYNFHQAKAATTGTVSLGCQPGKSIEIKAATCSAFVTGGQGHGQENQYLGTMTYTNSATTPKKIEGKSNISGITFTSKGCLGIVPEKGTNGTYKGESSGESTGGAIDIEVV